MCGNVQTPARHNAHIPPHGVLDSHRLQRHASCMALFRSLDNLAREHTERAVEVIAEILNDPLAEPRDRIKAADSILDRGHGKPLTATIALPANRQQAAMLAAMSDDELMQRIQGAPLRRLSQETVIDVDLEPDPLLR